MGADMAYQLGDHVHAAIRCPKADCRRLLINDQPCSCTWSDPTFPADPLIGQAAIVVDGDGRILVHGIVTAVDRTGDDLELAVTQHPA